MPRCAPAVPVTTALLPARADGYGGRPGLTGSRAGRSFSPAFALTGVSDDLVISAADPVPGLELRSQLRLGPTGVLELRHTLRNASAEPYELSELACVLPVPAVARELLDLTGRWCRERAPQRRVPGLGTWLRETRHGRTGFDATLLLVAGTPGFGWRAGEVWGAHLAWSGDAATWSERLPDGTSVLGASELLGPGEIILAPGRSTRRRGCTPPGRRAGSTA